MYDFSAEIADCARAVEAGLDQHLQSASLSGPGPASERVLAAMRHGSLEGGNMEVQVLVIGMERSIDIVDGLAQGQVAHWVLRIRVADELAIFAGEASAGQR